jgi:hypothetical protein
MVDIYSKAIQSFSVEMADGRVLALDYPKQILKDIAIDLGTHMRTDYNAKRKVVELRFLQIIAKENAERATKIPKNKITQCASCGVLINKKYENRVVFPDGERSLCKVCNDKYKQCHVCGKTHPKWAMRDLKFRDPHTDDISFKPVCGLCEEDLTRCAICGCAEPRTEDQEYTQIGNSGLHWVCDCCKRENTYTCEVCNCQFVAVGRPKTCPDCKMYSEPIISYMSKPRPIFSIDQKREKAENTQLYTGVELEVEAVEDSAVTRRSLAMDAKVFWPPRFVYCKKDSSLRNGLEIITQPFSWMHFKTNKPKWKEFFTLIDHCGYGSYKTAGMHVHVNKTAFTTWHLYKFCQFFYREQNRSFLSSVSDRVNMRENRHCRFEEIDVKNTKFMAKHKNNAYGGDHHHCALNLSPANSVEVRIFQSPDTVKEFYKNIEFIHAVYEYTMNTPPSQMWPSRFLNWLKVPGNARRFPNLVNHILNSKRYGDAYVKLLK